MDCHLRGKSNTFDTCWFSLGLGRRVLAEKNSRLIQLLAGDGHEPWISLHVVCAYPNQQKYCAAYSVSPPKAFKPQPSWLVLDQRSSSFRVLNALVTCQSSNSLLGPLRLSDWRASSGLLRCTVKGAFWGLRPVGPGSRPAVPQALLYLTTFTLLDTAAEADHHDQD